MALAILCSGQLGQGGESDENAQSNFTTIVLRVPKNIWLLSDLDKKARTHIWGERGLTNTAIRQLRVIIDPHDQTVMCELTFAEGVGKPLSKVKIGYDGKILGIQRVPSSQDAEFDREEGSDEPPVTVVLGQKEWRLKELDRLGRNCVWGEAGPPLGAVRYTRVEIRPRDKTTMCLLTYSSGIFRSFWDVEIDQEGRAQLGRKGTIRH